MCQYHKEASGEWETWGTSQQKSMILCSYPPLHTDSSLLLITALNSSVNKTRWQHMTACDIEEVYIKNMIYVLLSRLLYQVATGPRRGPALSAARLGGLVTTGRSPTPLDAGVSAGAREGEPTSSNETSLSVPGPHHPAKLKMCVSVKQKLYYVVYDMCGSWGRSVAEGGVGCFYSCCIL